MTFLFLRQMIYGVFYFIYWWGSVNVMKLPKQNLFSLLLAVLLFSAHKKPYCKINTINHLIWRLINLPIKRFIQFFSSYRNNTKAFLHFMAISFVDFLQVDQYELFKAVEKIFESCGTNNFSSVWNWKTFFCQLQKSCNVVQ